MTGTIQEQRRQSLNDLARQEGDYVLYWMQQSQRAVYNHALEHAIQQANSLGQPLLVAFGLMDDYPEANARHYTFMLQGLKETQATLAEEGIRMVVRRGQPHRVALALGRNASLIVCDRGYLRHQKAWRETVAREADCRLVQVETDTVVPVEVVSDKAEYAARTIRPKIQAHLHNYLVPLSSTPVEQTSLHLEVDGIDLDDVEAVVAQLDVDRSVPAVNQFFQGGTAEAQRIWHRFLAEKVGRYADNRNQPQTDDVSHMSMYLHFGQISPLALALSIQDAGDKPQADRDAYLEELIVRRELALNFVHYTPDYDSLVCLPEWARKTLADHREDGREPSYTRQQLEDADTHDAYWNAAMEEMKVTGYMHNYMRMYWGKKILEWSPTPEDAYRTTLALNNKYFLDGRDPNSYANVGWIFGLHDRAWGERPIFGKVRYMSAAGLERKCDIHAYVEKVAEMTADKS